MCLLPNAAAIPRSDVSEADRAARLDRDRVEVGLDRDAALLVHQGKHHLGQVEALGRAEQQVVALHSQRGADGLRATVQDPDPSRRARDASRQPASSRAFSASRSATSGTGTRWLRTVNSATETSGNSLSSRL